MMIYTDGAYSHKSKVGGWAFIVVNENTVIRHNSGCDFNTTNNRMELTAVHRGLIDVLEIEGPTSLTVVSDSSYIVHGYLRNHRRHANVDLWNLIDSAMQEHESIEWRLVKGHKGNAGNELADKYATQARTYGEVNIRV